MENKAELKVQGLQCDNTLCDYVDMSILREDYEKYIDSPCPKCGENLLTLEDYNNVLILEEAVRLTNTMSEEQINEITKNISAEQEEEIKNFLINTHKNITFTEVNPA